MLRIGLIRQLCEKAAIQSNLDSVSRYLAAAAALDVDIVGFPEMNITGYADPVRYPQAVIRLDGPQVADFLRRTRVFPGTVLAGLIEENPGQKPFISHIAARRGAITGVYRKVTIEDEEVEWFSPGAGVPVFQHDDLTFGIAICADISNRSVFSECVRQGARIIFELAAPGLYGEQSSRNWQSGYAWWEGECIEKLGGYARDMGCWIAVATQAGRTIDEDFPGGGFLFAPGGARTYTARDWQPGASFLEIDLKAGRAWEIPPSL